MNNGLVQQIIKLIESGEFRCTADWYTEKVDPEPQPDPGADFIEFIPNKPWKDLIDPEHLKWYDERGRCKNILLVEIEYEYGDYGTILSAYPVINGDCAEVHGYANGEGGLYEELVTRYSERQQLAKSIKDLFTIRLKNDNN